MGTNNSFFAGANSENGFISYYSSVDSDSENTMVYNIVGGPGTGKSSLLNKIYEYGKAAEYECERYFCSSDPSSLDAVKISSAKIGRAYWKAIIINKSCVPTVPAKAINTNGNESKI